MFTVYLLAVVLSKHALAAPVCTEIKSALDIMKCMRTSQPAFLAAKKLRSAEEDARLGGSRWINPELQTQNVGGKSAGKEELQLQIALYQPIQTGGKRKAQILSGEATALGLQARSRSEQGQSLKSAALGLYRYKQLFSEILAIQEAAETFKKLVNQYQKRPTLTPEQEVSLSIFRLAQGDYELRLIEKKNEEQQVLNFFRAQLGIDLSQYVDILPLYKEPSEKELTSFDPASLTKKSPDLVNAQSELTQAQANTFQARGNAYTDVSFGPMMMINRDGTNRQNLLGFALNFPIPVWNQNGYQVAAAQKQAELFEEKIKIRESEIELEIKRTLATMRQTKQRLAALPSQINLHERHEQAEKNFFRGLVSPAIIVEAHRALVDFLIQRHESENFVMGNLWDLYTIADRLEEKEL